MMITIHKEELEEDTQPLLAHKDTGDNILHLSVAFEDDASG